MQRAFRFLKRLTLWGGALILLAIPLIGLISTALTYQGLCHGFTDGQSPCPWWQYALNETFWAMFLLIPFLFVTTLLWLGMAALQFVASLINRPPQEPT